MIYPQWSSYLIACFILWHLPQIWYQWPDKKDDLNFVTESSYHLFWGSPLIYGEIRFPHCVSFLCCVFFVCLSSVSYVHSCTVLSIVRSWLPLRFSLKFNFDAFFWKISSLVFKCILSLLYRWRDMLLTIIFLLKVHYCNPVISSSVFSYHLIFKWWLRPFVPS